MDLEEPPEPPHIKEEEEELWSSQEGEQLHGLEEADITKFTSTSVPVKSEEDDEEKPQSSQLHQTQTERIKTEADGEDCGGPEPPRNSDPERHLQPDTDDKTEDSEPDTDDSDDWTESREPQSGLNSKRQKKVSVSDVRCKTDKKTFICTECGKRFDLKGSLKRHLKIHTGEKPFNCSECGERFGRKFNLRRHIRIHTGEKPFNCSVCGKSFTQGGRLTEHMAGHTGEKPFSCSVCDRRFTWLYQLKRHKCSGESSKLREVWSSQEGAWLQGLVEADITKVTVTPVPVKSEEDDEEKPQSSQLHQTQTEQLKTEADEDCGGPEPARNSDPERHLQPDTDDKTEDYFGPRTVDWKETRRPDSCLNSLKNNVLLVSDVRCRTGKNSFNCSVCGKRFSHNSKLNRHMRIHTGEKPFSCSLCSKSFTQKASLDHHLKTHTGEKPYSCSLCSKCYLWNADLEIHMRTHTGEKPYSCSFCNKCFSQYTHLQSHTRTHTGEKPLSCSVCHKRFTWHAQLKRHKCAGESSQLQELSTSQEGEQLQGLEEADITKFTSTSVPVKSEEDDEEKPQSSQLHQTQTEQLKTEADEDCGGPEPARNSDPERHLQPDADNKASVCLKNNDTSRNNVIFSTSEKSFSCFECGRIFPWKEDLVHHMEFHSGEKPYLCSICGRGFTQGQYLSHHMARHIKRFSCRLCDRRFTWLYQLKNHQCVGHELSELHQSQNEENRESEPPACSSTDTMNTKAHGEDVGGPKTTRSPDQERHLQPDTNDKTEDSSEPKTNDSDDWKESRQRQTRSNPQKNHEVPVSDIGCKTEEKSLSSSKCGKKPLRCSICGSGFTRKANLICHMKRHTGEKPFSCAVCKKLFRHRGDVQRHMKIHTRDKSFRKIMKSFSCSECGKGFSRKEHLIIHMRIHTGEKPYSCSLCNKCFSRGKYLQSHMRTHTGEKLFSCSVCGKRFGQKSHLQFHLKCHTGEKPYSCSLCKKCFLRNRDLERHMRTHTGEKPIICSVCDQKFSWHYQFKWHKCKESSQLHKLCSSQEGEQLQGLKKTHITKVTVTPVPVMSEDDEEEKPQFSQRHQTQTEADGEDCGGPEPTRNSDPERRLQPDTDDKSEDWYEHKTDDLKETREPKSGLNSQKNNEVPEIDVGCRADKKPFNCSECGERFGRKFNLRRHIRIHTGEKPFNCSVCGKSFTQGGRLTEHMAGHTGEKPFSCSVCDRRFTWLYQLKRHKCSGESSKLREVWSSQEGERLQGLVEEADITKVTVTPVSLKAEDDDEEKPQSS